MPPQFRASMNSSLAPERPHPRRTRGDSGREKTSDVEWSRLWTYANGGVEACAAKVRDRIMLEHNGTVRGPIAAESITLESSGVRTHTIGVLGGNPINARPCNSVTPSLPRQVHFRLERLRLADCLHPSTRAPPCAHRDPLARVSFARRACRGRYCRRERYEPTGAKTGALTV